MLDGTAALLDGVLQQGRRDTGRCDVLSLEGDTMEAAYSSPHRPFGFDEDGCLPLSGSPSQ